MKNSRSDAYAAAGVDITAGYRAVELMKKAVLSNTPEFRCRATDEQVYILSYVSETRVCRLQLPGQPEIEVKLLPGKMNVIKAKVAGNGKLIAPDGREYPVTLECKVLYS